MSSEMLHPSATGKRQAYPQPNSRSSEKSVKGRGKNEGAIVLKDPTRRSRE